MKIAIIGNAGSGKSTLASDLHKKLKIPLYHLDKYFWKPGWQEPERTEFHKIHNELCDKGTWIIEGVATGCFEYRAEKADVIIFLDMPTYICLYRVFKRAYVHFGTVRPCGADGCPERFPSFKFLKFMLLFNSTRRPTIHPTLKKHSAKKIFIVKNKTDLAGVYSYFDLPTV